MAGAPALGVVPGSKSYLGPAIARIRFISERTLLLFGLIIRCVLFSVYFGVYYIGREKPGGLDNLLQFRHCLKRYLVSDEDFRSIQHFFVC
jgi:hypothetical protein